MEANPYTFDSKNPRIVTNCQRDARVLPAAAVFFLGGLYMYNKRRFRLDQNFVNLVGFTIGSVPASLIMANQFFGDPVVEAGILNNQRETGNWAHN